jgi:hypothetical protein
VTTPQAPWTMNCSKNAPAVSVPHDVGKIQSGIRAAPQTQATMMVARRPKNCE